MANPGKSGVWRGVALLVVAAAFAVDAVATDAVVDLYPLCPYERKLDGQWQGSMVASDGKTYFGSSTHAYDAAGLFFQYDPATAGVTQIGPDLSTICGEDASTQVPQGKLHSPIVESNGWLYTSTHLANYWTQAEDAYTGAHLIGYQLGSLEAGSPVFRDFGIPRTRFSCYSAVGVDPAGEWLWSLATPFAGADSAVTGSHVYRTNIATGAMTDIGEINPSAHGGACNYFHVDARGDCWMTLLSGGQDKLFVARAATGAIESFDHALPTMSHQYIPGAASAYQSQSGWRWGHSVDSERFLFTMRDSGAPYADMSGGSVYEFDASKTLDGDLSDAFREVAWVGGTHLGMAYGADRVYFVQRSDGSSIPKIDAVGGNGEYWDPAADNGVRHHLCSISVTDPNEGVRDWGMITDDGGRVPWRLEGASADDNGRVFMTGDWVMKETDPVEWRTLRHDGYTSTTYTLHIRGQGMGAFIAALAGDFTVDASIDIDDVEDLWTVLGATVGEADEKYDLVADSVIDINDA